VPFLLLLAAAAALAVIPRRFGSRRGVRGGAQLPAGPSARVVWLPSRAPSPWQATAIEAIARQAGARGLEVVTVTSGTRSVEDQARAMLRKLELFGPGDLMKVYGEKARGILEQPADLASWAAYLEQTTAAGVRWTRHTAGEALDLRTRDLTPEQREAQVQAVKAAGYGALVEADHLHVQ
jgi:hypothetical protein